jgi:sugar O-acyltransferase (sialic acid O-acetyltransferase NeuD family)
MKNKKLIIFGITEMSVFVSHYFSSDSDYEIVAYCVDKEYKNIELLNNLPVLTTDEVLETYSIDEYYFFIAIGPTKMNVIREDAYNKIKQFGYKFANYISSKAICDGEIGNNNFIAAYSVINPNVRIGNNNIIYEHCLASIGASINNHCYISPKAYIGTNSIINNNSILGINCVIKNGVNVAPKSLIGACSYISRNTEFKGVYGVKQTPLSGCISDKINISMI